MIASKQKIVEAKTIYGRTIQEIVAKEPERGIYKVLGAIEVLVSSKIFQKLPTSPAERMVFAFTWLAREVQNGGFHQFFVNSAGDFWKDVLDGLVAIEDEDGLTLFRQVLSIFPDSSPSESRDDRLDQLAGLEEQDEEKVWDHFNNLTDRYYSTPFPKWELVFGYVKSHPNEFDLRNA